MTLMLVNKVKSEAEDFCRTLMTTLNSKPDLGGRLMGSYFKQQQFSICLSPDPPEIQN